MPKSDSAANEFYRRSMEVLREAEVPFLLGGAYAFCLYTGIARHTKDFDLFVRPDDIDRALTAFRQAGYRAEKTFPHSLGKAFGSEDTIDIIFRAGNGLCTVDELWFERAAVKDVFGMETGLCPPEEMLWMKAYVMERERFDGADVAHLLLHCAAEMDWDRLLRRFGPDWRVLLAHLREILRPREQGAAAEGRAGGLAFLRRQAAEQFLQDGRGDALFSIGKINPKRMR